MRFDEGDDFRRYIIRLRALASQIYQQINLMREAIRRGATNHRVSVVSPPLSLIPHHHIQPTPIRLIYGEKADRG